jgi:hypothetical protein
LAHCWCASSTGAERVLRSFVLAGWSTRLAGLVALPSRPPSRPTFVLPSHEGTRQAARRTALFQDLGPFGLLRHRPAHTTAGHPDRRPACARPSRDSGDTDRPRQAPLLGLVSLQRMLAALRCPEMPYPGRSRSGVADGQGRRPNFDQLSRIPAFPHAHSCGFSPGVTGSDVWFPSSFACPPSAARHSPERPFQPGVPVLLRQICAAWPAFCFAGSAHGIQPFAALLRTDSSATSSVSGGPPDVRLSHPPR